ncbi:hypothetical protein [Deinococcus sp. 6GRE01]|uniref:hypothetical protein n=1 Tax=Deinococcus sp. 6GRE01 TaxID=2745873 RepID=UPI001E5BBD35|nr:hypothetical protein [Deinococcus sp. 6GRE01]MCD0156021.1 hypothetical protein [Deinococcus sp. 6GRE01]
MTTPAKKGRGKGRTSKQLRYLFAARILTGSGKGKNRSVSYNPKRARNVQALRKRGVNTTRKYRNTPTGSNRPVIGGSKAAGLRSGAAARPRPRAERIAAGKAIANRPDVARKALKGSGLRVREARARPGLPASQQRGPLTATGKNTSLSGDTRFLVRTARTEGKLPKRSVPKKGSAAYAATRAERIAAGKKLADAHPEVKLWGGNREGLKRANAFRASTAPLRRQKAAQRKVDIAKATDRYTKALTKANTDLMDAKAQRSKRRAYDKLISTISGGFKSKRHAYKSEIDSALRRATYSARKAGALIL